MRNDNNKRVTQFAWGLENFIEVRKFPRSCQYVYQYVLPIGIKEAPFSLILLLPDLQVSNSPISSNLNEWENLRVWEWEAVKPSWKEAIHLEKKNHTKASKNQIWIFFTSFFRFIAYLMLIMLSPYNLMVNYWPCMNNRS